MKETVAYQDFAKLDFRVGLVKQAQVPDWSQKLLEMTVDFGQQLGVRTILVGAKKHYQPNDFIGNNYLFLLNLAEKKMGQAVSQGMMLMADDQNRPIKFELPASLRPGTVVR